VPHLVLALALGTLIGVSLGLLGGGGSILAVPLLVYVARIDVHSAIGTSIALLRRRELLSQERIDLLNSWRRSGFSVHNRVFVHPRDGREFEALVRYMMRPR
jgi:hypothetical protein